MSDETVQVPPPTQRNKGSAYRVRLPGFITGKDVGLGDVIKRATSAVGIQPCGSCQRQRAAVLNRWMTFSGRLDHNGNFQWIDFQPRRKPMQPAEGDNVANCPSQWTAISDNQAT